MALAELIRTWCRFLGIPYRMTRDGNEAIYSPSAVTIREKKVSDLQNRLKIIENTADVILLSIHMNASPAKSARGLQVFYARSNDSDRLAAALTEAFSRQITEQRVKPSAEAPGSVYLMKHAVCPAVILEYGFISNPAEEQLLLQGRYRQKLAYLTICGTLRFINEKG